MHVRVFVCLRACVRGRAAARQEVGRQTRWGGAVGEGAGPGSQTHLSARRAKGAAKRLSLCALRGRWGPRIPTARSSSCAHHARPHLETGEKPATRPPSPRTPLPRPPSPEAAQAEGPGFKAGEPPDRGAPRAVSPVAPTPGPDRRCVSFPAASVPISPAASPQPPPPASAARKAPSLLPLALRHLSVLVSPTAPRPRHTPRGTLTPVARLPLGLSLRPRPPPLLHASAAGGSASPVLRVSRRGCGGRRGASWVSPRPPSSPVALPHPPREAIV